MKQKAKKDSEYSIDYMNSLILFISRSSKLTEEQICGRLDYNEGYISQCRSRGNVPGKFIKTLKREFGVAGDNPFYFDEEKGEQRITFDYEETAILLHHHEAAIKALTEALAKMCARVYNRPVEDCLEELKQNTVLRLKSGIKVL